jgi:hypothetical protein
MGPTRWDRRGELSKREMVQLLIYDNPESVCARANQKGITRRLVHLGPDFVRGFSGKVARELCLKEPFFVAKVTPVQVEEFAKRYAFSKEGKQDFISYLENENGNIEIVEEPSGDFTYSYLQYQRQKRGSECAGRR